MLDIAMEPINFIITFINSMGLGERVSIATGLIYIVLSVRQNALCWPFGIVSVAIWMVVVFQGKLYSDAFLQFIYVVLGFYGWHQWLRGGKDHEPLKVRKIDLKLSLRLAAIGLITFIPLGYISENYLGASFPWWDALTTVISLIAQYLLAKKYLENWILWITADAMYIVIYYLKGWTGYSGLMTVYTVMAIIGFAGWLKSYKADRVQQCQPA
ncbi:nicotinamide mononucleotide transporter [Maridesulfovibrio ferrireducens]|uniref:Nicotinamide riboside transporter PnuC n=1 Tax=Maridesulfovibrio ferrireducens TaxID=246191 RepID=A0A1G9KA89_9BACT|nr:nicotinamide riboside transporter PnuC [Maridesulfovibrio ferrireducens]SDL46203.1 nicotinamide mononucleotide transporter [Maridesulfovibrio ferrireducens]